MKKYNLTPTRGQKSFYGKAKVIETFKIEGGGKKWWLSLPCENASGERYKIEYGNGFYSRTLSIVFDNYDDASAEAERLEKSINNFCFAEVIEA